MPGQPTLLKALLKRRHQETHRAFCLEYDKAARSIDRSLVGSSPSREAFARWLNGHLKTKPHSDHCRVLERMFPGHTVAELLAPYDSGRKSPGASDSRLDPKEATTNRREVFHLGASAMTVGLMDAVNRGPDLLEQALDTGNAGEARLLYLEQEVERLGSTVPPLSTLPDALLCLASVRELLAHRQPSRTQQRLARVGARLCIVIGEIMFCANRFPMARRWYAAAVRAADEANDSYLSDLALASTALMPIYAGDARGVLALVRPRLEQAVGATPALAWLWGFDALANASLGDRAAFDRAISRCRTTLDRCAPDSVRAGILSFQPDRQALYEARGRSELGDVEGTSVATARALALSDPTASADPALARLAHATVLVKVGEVEEACRIATAALRDPHTPPTVSVLIRAHDFDAELNHTGATTAAWREALTDLRVPDPASLIARAGQTAASPINPNDHLQP